MTTVTGTLVHPVTGDPAVGYITVFLVNDRGERVQTATYLGDSITGDTSTLLVAGAYSITLVGNADIETEELATFWAVEHASRRVLLDVPVSGTWDETDITHNPTRAAPGPTATNLITSSTITSAVSGLVTVAFPPVFPTITGIMITVPDLTSSIKLEACAPVLCPATSNITVGTFIVDNGTAQSVAADYHALPTATLPATFRPFAVLPPNSGGDYVLKLYSFTNCTLTCDAQTGQPAGLWAYSV